MTDTASLAADIANRSARHLAGLLQAGDLSAVDLINHLADRIGFLNPDINAFTLLCLEEARAQATNVDEDASRGAWRGPLHGLPYAVKDVFDVAGMATTFGCRPLIENMATEDAVHVARLRAAGAVIIGKTNLPEFALGGQTTNRLVGTTRNPLDPSKSVAGSSGGAAAALASGMTVLADGSDLGGSLRGPAAWTGTLGLRPSSGTVPWKSGHALPIDLHGPGPMGRCVDDIVLMLGVMQGAHPDMPRSWTLSEDKPLPERPNGKYRLAWSPVPCGARVDPEIKEVLTEVVGCIERDGHQVEETCPDLKDMLKVQSVFRRLNTLMEAGPSIDGREMQFARNVTKTVLDGKALSPEDLSRAMRLQGECWSKLSATFDTFDFLIWPTTSGPACSADLADDAMDEDWIALTTTPALGIPALSLPAGRLADGMPVGLQILGPRGSDFALLEFARKIETLLSHS